MPKARYWSWLIILLVFIFDQYSKQYMMSMLANTTLSLYQWLQLKLAFNTGVGFSLGSNLPNGWLIAVNIVIVLALLVWFYRAKHSPSEQLALSFILGGALGNIYDRSVYGYVIDFIDVHYQLWHWPTFNVADIAISLGVVIMVKDLLWKR